MFFGILTHQSDTFLGWICCAKNPKTINFLSRLEGVWGFFESGECQKNDSLLKIV